MFDALGVNAIAGRTFLPSDDMQRANVVVLSEAFWRARFNADPSVVGRDLRLDGGPWTVVGVVPQRGTVDRPDEYLGPGPDPRVGRRTRAVSTLFR